MAFGKKDSPTPPTEAATAADPADDAPEETPVEAGGDADAGMMASLAADPEPEPDAGGVDALLDMFGTVGVEVVDRTLLTGLAGEVEMTDLISELSVVAAALGVVMSERSGPGTIEDEQLAA